MSTFQGEDSQNMSPYANYSTDKTLIDNVELSTDDTITTHNDENSQQVGDSDQSSQLNDQNTALGINKITSTPFEKKESSVDDHLVRSEPNNNAQQAADSNDDSVSKSRVRADQEEKDTVEWKKFQNSNDENIRQIEKKNSDIKSETLIHEERRFDKRESNPDHVVSVDGNKVVADSKYYPNENAIPIRDYNKIKGDVTVQDAEGGLLLMDDKAKIADNFYKAVKNRTDEVALIKLEKQRASDEQELKSKALNPNYVNERNQKTIENAAKVMSQHKPDLDVHITPNHKVDKRSKIVKQGRDSVEELKEAGVKFKKSDSTEVDGRCVAAREDKEYHRIKEEKRNLTNYDHKEAKKQYQERRKQEKENQQPNTPEEKPNKESNKKSQADVKSNNVDNHSKPKGQKSSQGEGTQNKAHKT